jgi:hypothetical protein
MPVTAWPLSGGELGLGVITDPQQFTSIKSLTHVAQMLPHKCLVTRVPQCTWSSSLRREAVHRIVDGDGLSFGDLRLWSTGFSNTIPSGAD